jgi:hypothetical protein
LDVVFAKACVGVAVVVIGGAVGVRVVDDCHA